MNQSESEERQYLELIKSKLHSTLETIAANVNRYAKEIREQKAYLWENKTGMDHVEKISVRQAVSQSVLIGEAVLAQKKRLQKLWACAYFGRFDFKQSGQAQGLPIYIGIHAFFDEKENTSLIHDWRAPISTLFYDYEIGPADYQSPGGKVEGEIVLKRQYRIRDGVMEFMLESAINIHDDILQKELSVASDERMKNIVATIQRDQNAIIRNEASQVLIIQGVAGSGKTSIALHRIAFLLYRFKETIKSSDILIISPNEVFSDYISNVLPELGEEKIPETGIERLAQQWLEYQYKFQTFFEQVALLLEKDDQAFRQRIQIKATFEFLNKLNEYIAYIDQTYFTPADFRVKGYLVPAWFMDERFKLYPDMPIFKRLVKVANEVETNIRLYYNYDVTPQEREEIKIAVGKMFKFRTLRALYKDFYAWMGTPALCKLSKNSVFEYSDVFPLIYLKICLEGGQVQEQVKHLLIDEMQDYTPVQYAVLAALFPCKKTILGDANQSVNPFSSSSAQDIQKVFADADYVQLCKSYRSTYQITRFAQRISPNAQLEAIERHGPEPNVLSFKTPQEEIEEIMRLAKASAQSGKQSLGIICKTQK